MHIAMKNYSTIKKRLLKDKDVQKAYNELEPEFALIQMIIHRRINQGLTQAALARKIGTKQSAIARLESGTYNPSFAFLTRVAGALNAQLKVSLS